MIDPIPPAAAGTQERQSSQSKTPTKPGTSFARPSQETDESQDTVQLSAEALAAAHGDADYEVA
jgi:hypothetical protein